jgi:hypothetical protein
LSLTLHKVEKQVNYIDSLADAETSEQDSYDRISTTVSRRFTVSFCEIRTSIHGIHRKKAEVV